MDSKKEIILTLDLKKIVAATMMVGIILLVIGSYITALFAFVAPSRDYPFRITQVETKDENNATVISFNTNDVVRINSTIEKAISYVNFPFSYAYYDFMGFTNVRIIVTIVDGNQVPVYLQSVSKTISPGESIHEFFDYTSARASGIYTIKVMIWSDWLPAGIALSDSAWEETFSVV